MSKRESGKIDDGSFDYDCELCQDSGIFMIDLDDMGEQAGIDYCSCNKDDGESDDPGTDIAIDMGR